MACNLTASPLPSLLHSYVPQSLRPFVTLSYPITDPLAHPSAQILYDKGPQDACLVLFWALAFTLLREAFMKGVFSPFMRICLPSPPQIKGQEREYAKARKKREHTVTRFAEQGWSWLYCSIYWTFGVVSAVFRHCSACQGLTFFPLCRLSSARIPLQHLPNSSGAHTRPSLSRHSPSFTISPSSVGGSTSCSLSTARSEEKIIGRCLGTTS